MARKFFLHMGFCAAIIPFFISAVAWAASSVMAVGQDEGYSGRVMDKIITKWKPPKQLKKECRLKLRIGLDGQGRVLECVPTRSSGLEAVDASACAAVRAASPYGAPPYGMPADVYLTFWTGATTNMLPPEELPEDARVKADAMSAEARALAANDRARAMAEKAARTSGKTPPASLGKAKDGKKETTVNHREKEQKIHEKSPEAAPIALNPKKESPPEKENMPEKQAAEKKSVPVKAVAEKNSRPETPPAPAHVKEEKKPEIKEMPKNEAAPAMPDISRYDLDALSERYLSRTNWKLRNAMYVPMEAKPGTYETTVELKCDRTGKILSSSILKGSGDEVVDRYVMQGIKRAKRVDPPPHGLGDTFDLTFTLIRK